MATATKNREPRTKNGRPAGLKPGQEPIHRKAKTATAAQARQLAEQSNPQSPTTHPLREIDSTITAMDRAEALELIQGFYPGLAEMCGKMWIDQAAACAKRHLFERPVPLAHDEPGEVKLTTIDRGVVVERDGREGLLDWLDLAHEWSEEPVRTPDDQDRQTSNHQATKNGKKPQRTPRKKKKLASGSGGGSKRDPKANEYGVFTRPDSVVKVKLPASWKCVAEVRLAKRSDGKWCFGYEYRLGVGEGGSGPPMVKNPSYPSRDQALLTGLHHLIGWWASSVLMFFR